MSPLLSVISNTNKWDITYAFLIYCYKYGHLLVKSDISKGILSTANVLASLHFSEG
jgi:hypothetical protein